MKGLSNVPVAASSSSRTATDNPAEVDAAFVNAVLAQGHAYNALQRRQAVKSLINYFKEQSASSQSAEYVNAVTALKTLGRSQDGSEDLASVEGINLLLVLAQFTTASSASNDDDAFLRDPLQPAASEAIRCLANVCLLHEEGRIRLAKVEGLPEVLMKSGEQATDPTTQFLAARLLFLVTVSGVPSTIVELVENLHIARYLSTRLLRNLDELTAISAGELNIVNPKDATTKMKIDVMIEYLKVAFNVSLFYPRATQEKGTKSSRGDKYQTVENGSASQSSKDKAKAESSNMSKSLSSSSTSSTSSSSSTKGKSRSSSPIESFIGRTSPKSSKTSNTATASSTSSTKDTSTSSSNMSPSDSASGSTSTSNGRSKSPSNYPKMASDKIKGYFSSSSSSSATPTTSSSRKGKESEIQGGGKDGKNVADDKDVLKAWGFEDLVSALVQLALCLPFASGPDFGPFGVYKHIINALVNYNFTAYSSTIYPPLSPFNACPIGALPTTSPTKAEPSLPPLVARLLTLLDGTLEYYIPGTNGPDDEDARSAAMSAPGVLDESLQVLILLLAKCAIEDVTGDVRRGIKLCLLADDIDRSVGLEKRADLTGRLIRLLNSAYLSGSAEAAGKFLFSICDQDPSSLVAAIGYGNASGFLQSMGMLIPPGATAGEASSESINSTSGNGNEASSGTPRPINPITGAYEPASPTNVPSMTDDEKEREAEKLFVLFDRMNRNGAMSVVNPVKQAHESGKLQSTAEEEENERKRLQEQEEEDERQALAEMQRYKERKNRTT